MATVIERTLRRVVSKGDDEALPRSLEPCECGGQQESRQKREYEGAPGIFALLDVVHGQGLRGAADRIGLALVRALGGTVQERSLPAHPK